ncbi:MULTISPECIES: hypothetical protein [Halorussus]|uniref:hypothetical protein n=1 Tax=Halorussus TaxID=1070314 RepID=UPI000E214092|nr:MULTISPECIES: hypothetical protein [Halorussus]NHN58955.1 hypothetical protein [Halorussus sp. JP-T4]
MTKEALASWLLKQSDVPLTVLKPVATRLGISTNYVGAALFAGQIAYENQDTIVKYTSKGGVTVGEFLYERSRDRYGPDHPLTQHLGENVEAITEAFAGTEEEARTFAEFYRRYRAVDRRHRLRDEVDASALSSVADRLPGRDDVPGPDDLPDRTDLPGADSLPDAGALSGLRGDGDDPDDADPEDVVDIPVTGPK